MEVVGFLSSLLRMNAAKTESSKDTKVPVATPDRYPAVSQARQSGLGRDEATQENPVTSLRNFLYTLLAFKARRG